MFSLIVNLHRNAFISVCIRIFAVSVVYSPSSLSPLRSDEFDHQQSSITLLKAQLKLVTQERDLLKKDLKRISQERDGAIRHLSLSTSPQSSVDTSSHHRTNSDTAPQISKAGEQRLNYKMIHVTRA